MQEETIVQNNNEEQFLNSFQNETNIESMPDESLFELDSTEQVSSQEEHTPKLFSDESSTNENSTSSKEIDKNLFDQENNQEEDFEIPAFLRRQKF